MVGEGFLCLSLMSAEFAAASEVQVSDSLQIENFLNLEEHDRLLNYTLQQEANFISTTTSTGKTAYRQSQVLYDLAEFSQLILDRIQTVLPNVVRQLNLPAFEVSQIEMQLTAHNDQHYYKLHNDNGSAEAASRKLTYVYYFYREPKAFSGGALRIYDSKITNDFYIVAADTFHTIEPHNNSIVFFPSYYLHEVLPVCCPSQAFADSRFTVNGWVRG